MKYLSLLLISLLYGCATVVPVTAKFPDSPSLLMVKCPQLKIIEGDTTTLSNLTTVITINYTTYYECAVKTDEWIEWYNIQKTIFEKAGK